MNTKVIEPQDDVDADELAELGEDYDLKANQIFYKVFLSGPADYKKARQHTEKHGIDCTGKTMRETNKLLKGADILAFLEQDTFTNRAGEIDHGMKATSFSPVE